MRGLLLLLAGCEAPTYGVAPVPCQLEAPPDGEVVARTVSCSAELVDGGEGRSADTLLANSRIRAIVRYPNASLSVPGLGGGTVVDAAPWGYRDRLLEAIPIVGGGWLDVEEFTVEPDGVVVSGTVVPFPDRPAPAAGERRDVAWRIQPDAIQLDLEGADGLWLHVGEGGTRLDHAIVGETSAYGGVGGTVEDLGGVVLFDGATGLLVAKSRQITDLLYPDGPVASGSAPNASRLVLLSGDAEVVQIPLADDDFDLHLPPGIDGLRAEADDRSASRVVAPGEGLELHVGKPGAIALSVAWPDRARWSAVRWSDARGRIGEAELPPAGARLDLGAGRYDLRVESGPAFLPVDVRVEVGGNETVPLPIAMRRRFDPGERALAAMPIAGAQSRTSRRADQAALVDLRAHGVDYAVFAPEDDVARPQIAGDPLGLRWEGGTVATSTDGWTALSWPWDPSTRLAGHGSPPTVGRSVEDVLASSWGGPGTDRFLAPDLPALAALPAPWDSDPQPDSVRLADPGPDGPASGAWDPWFAWLDAQTPLVPLGPLTWVSVGDASAVGTADVEAGLVRGQVCATTGPLLTFDVRGLGPGDAYVPDEPQQLEFVRVRIQGGAGEIEHAALLGDGGEVLHQWDVLTDDDAHERTLALPPHWMILAAWSSTGAFATTGPLWISPPT